MPAGERISLSTSSCARRRETELDGFVFYRRKSWEFRVNVTNITNARLVDPIDVSFAGNDTVFVRKPISASLTIKKHF